MFGIGVFFLIVATLFYFASEGANNFWLEVISHAGYALGLYHITAHLASNGFPEGVPWTGAPEDWMINVGYGLVALFVLGIAIDTFTYLNGTYYDE